MQLRQGPSPGLPMTGANSVAMLALARAGTVLASLWVSGGRDVML